MPQAWMFTTFYRMLVHCDVLFTIAPPSIPCGGPRSCSATSSYMPMFLRIHAYWWAYRILPADTHQFMPWSEGTFFGWWGGGVVQWVSE